MSVTQTGPLFRLEWAVDPAEDIEVWRTDVDPDVQIATVESGTTTFVDTRDDLEAGDTASWKLVGVTSLDEIGLSTTVADAGIPPLDDDRRFYATLLVASRLFKRQDAPFGVAGGGDYPAVPLRFHDPDVDALLVGLRATGSDLTQQTWPTVDEVRAFIGTGSATTDDELAVVRAAAVAIVSRKCKGAGIA